ncbi:MAG: beta-ketoacyl-ACP synthase II [Planctomycetota bacterium]
MSRRRVVITGIGVVSPIGIGLEQFWDGIVNCRSGAGPVSRFDPASFRTHFACEVKNFVVAEQHQRAMRNLDLYTQFALAAAFDAVADSGLKNEQEDVRRIGVITGTGVGGLGTIEQNYSVFQERGPSRVSPFLVPMMMANASAGNIAIHLGYQGPNFGVVSACASSNHAFGLAFDQVAHGGADVVVTGGSEAAITYLGLGGFNALKALSQRNDDPQRASRPFSGSRDGFVLGEGGAIFVFEEEARARKRGAQIYAEVCGFGMTDDASHITAPLPEGTMAAGAMRHAAEQAGIQLTDIDYINAHGTSTKLNDAMETRAIRGLFGAHAKKLMVSSTKSQIGHLLGASGAVELAAVVLGIRAGVVPPTINYQDPDPECDLDYVPNEPRAHRIRYALSNSFGFGGHNACICVGQYS